MKFLTSTILIYALLTYLPSAIASDVNQRSEPTLGVVAETMVSGGYVYMRLVEQGIWIATGSQSHPISVGDEVEYIGGMEMRDFYSKSLDRTFESIYFIQNVKLASQNMGAMHAGAMKDQVEVDMTIPKPPTVSAPAAGEIAQLPEGKTVADIFAGSAQLNKQTVSVNARVIKISKNIVGKNWITLQDGTGTEPDNKLLATSQDLVKLGDTVVAKGVVRTDIDIGSGYKYKVLLEEVTFSPGLN